MTEQALTREQVHSVRVIAESFNVDPNVTIPRALLLALVKLAEQAQGAGCHRCGKRVSFTSGPLPVRRTVNGEPLVFCSYACADQYACEAEASTREMSQADVLDAPDCPKHGNERDATVAEPGEFGGTAKIDKKRLAALQLTDDEAREVAKRKPAIISQEAVAELLRLPSFDPYHPFDALKWARLHRGTPDEISATESPDPDAADTLRRPVPGALRRALISCVNALTGAVDAYPFACMALALSLLCLAAIAFYAGTVDGYIATLD